MAELNWGRTTLQEARFQAGGVMQKVGMAVQKTILPTFLSPLDTGYPDIDDGYKQIQTFGATVEGAAVPVFLNAPSVGLMVYGAGKIISLVAELGARTVAEVRHTRQKAMESIGSFQGF